MDWLTEFSIENYQWLLGLHLLLFAGLNTNIHTRAIKFIASLTPENELAELNFSVYITRVGLINN